MRTQNETDKLFDEYTLLKLKKSLGEITKTENDRLEELESILKNDLDIDD